MLFNHFRQQRILKREADKSVSVLSLDVGANSTDKKKKRSLLEEITRFKGKS